MADIDKKKAAFLTSLQTTITLMAQGYQNCKELGAIYSDRDMGAGEDNELTDDDCALVNAKAADIHLFFGFVSEIYKFISNDDTAQCGDYGILFNRLRSDR